MSWDRSLGEIFLQGCAEIVTAIGEASTVLKDILAELQAQGKKVK